MATSNARKDLPKPPVQYWGVGSAILMAISIAWLILGVIYLSRPWSGHLLLAAGICAVLAVACAILVLADNVPSTRK